MKTCPLYTSLMKTAERLHRNSHLSVPLAITEAVCIYKPELNKVLVNRKSKEKGDEERKKEDNDYLYIHMTEIKWATSIATATAIAELEWKRQLKEASAAFKMWKKVNSRGTELDWSLYSARQCIRSLPAKHVWKNSQNRAMVLVFLRQVPMGHGRPKPVIKMVTPVALAAEMAMSEIKRQRAALKPKKKRKPPT